MKEVQNSRNLFNTKLGLVLDHFNSQVEIYEYLKFLQTTADFIEIFTTLKFVQEIPIIKS